MIVRVRSRAERVARFLRHHSVELRESHLSVAIIEARRVQEAPPIWEEPRPVHARFALRLIRGQNRDGSATRCRDSVDRRSVATSHQDDVPRSPGAVADKPILRSQIFTTGPSGRSMRINLPSAKNASEPLSGDQNS